MGDNRSEKPLKREEVYVTVPGKQNGEAAKRLMNGYAIKPETPSSSLPHESKKKSDRKKYKCVSLLFAFLNVVWIAMLIYLITTMAPPEERHCEPEATRDQATGMCLSCGTLPPKLRRSESRCCAKDSQEWQEFVTAFVNVEFAKRKRSVHEKVASSEAVPEPRDLSRRKRQAKEEVPVIREIEQNGTYFVSAEISIPFEMSTRASEVSCSIERKPQGGYTFSNLIEPVSVSACSVQGENNTCVMLINIGGIRPLEAKDTVKVKCENDAMNVVKEKTILLTFDKLV